LPWFFKPMSFFQEPLRKICVGEINNLNLTCFHIIKARNKLNQAWFTRTRSTKDTNNFTRLNIQSDIFVGEINRRQMRKSLKLVRLPKLMNLSKSLRMAITPRLNVVEPMSQGDNVNVFVSHVPSSWIRKFWFWMIQHQRLILRQIVWFVKVLRQVLRKRLKSLLVNGFHLFKIRTVSDKDKRDTKWKLVVLPQKA